MTPTLRRVGALVFAVAAVGIIVWNVVPTPSDPPPEAQRAVPTTYPTYTVPSPDVPLADSDAREYALALDELQGFPTDVPVGTHVEVWVGWDRPSGMPKLQRLIPRAEFVRLVPPVTPAGPTAVVLRVPIRRIPDLLWADGYGALSLTVIS
jgi:hypothetical protein